MSYRMFLLRVLVVLPVLAMPSCIPEDEPPPIRRVETFPPRPLPPPKPAFIKVDAKCTSVSNTTASATRPCAAPRGGEDGSRRQRRMAWPATAFGKLPGAWHLGAQAGG